MFIFILNKSEFSVFLQVKIIIMNNANINAIKQRFGIIGFDTALNHAIDMAVQVAVTDLSVIITGENGVGKENFPKIIHENSARKHKPYITVNCGAIPEGTIDSELFGHEKGAFTGAIETRKGYFEAADGGTIFLDEIAEMPIETQSRLLRILETGEYYRVGSAEVRKTNVRVIAATNVNLLDRIAKGKFREDLYYRLNSIPIHIPALRERKEDIFPLFMKFASDFSARYHFPPVELSKDAIETLKNYPWPGNIRQLKHITEHISLMAEDRKITAKVLETQYLPPINASLPALVHKDTDSFEQFQRSVYFIIADLKREISELKSALAQMSPTGTIPQIKTDNIKELLMEDNEHNYQITRTELPENGNTEPQYEESVIIEENESLSMDENEKKMIIKALEKHHGNRNKAATELGISPRTLYRRILQYGLATEKKEK